MTIMQIVTIYIYIYIYICETYVNQANEDDDGGSLMLTVLVSIEAITISIIDSTSA